MDGIASSGIQEGPLVPVAFVCFPVRDIYGGGFWGVILMRAFLLESEEVGDPVRTLCHLDFFEAVGLGLRDLLTGGGRLGGRGWGRPCFHSWAISRGYVVSRWAFLTVVMRLMGWAPFGSEMWSSALSGFAVPVHPDLHLAVWAAAFEAVMDCPFAPVRIAGVVVAERLLDPRTLLNFWEGVGLWRCRR